MNFNEILQLIEDDMQSVNRLIQERLHSDVVLINQLSHYIIGSGGKRLRPMLALISARACEYQGGQHIDTATIVEFIHTATLLHDDVVDESDLRRGKETANNVWGNQAAVLVGDFLYSRSFEMMVSVNSMRVMEILAGTTNIIAEGEVLQLLNCNDADTTEDSYMEVIHSKTAKLFEAACQLGAVLAELTPEQETAMANYGIHLGTAFQLVDDVLDYTADADEMGKNVGDDLAEGKPTLPLIIALQRSEGDTAAILREAIEKGGIENIDAIMQTIRDTGAIDYTLEKAKKEAEMAVDNLQLIPDSPYRQALETLAWFSIERSH
uniref:Octaprenyl diphosphate synthase n=1 Tax=uncultured Thiotrichaceae bacterium TaxID=298394 RepID=A0A6S6UL78_9GAMM|nr:MAG: Octaprenyl diphosphate synthase (EC / Dimethylallyltransferase (EC / (2E,6E)-farnesyl diphosphate synthase (EC / Geranylgeranyl pyrophosphate synthetase (EC [uncultured Thiotrichaceae bacterium]